MKKKKVINESRLRAIIRKILRENDYSFDSSKYPHFDKNVYDDYYKEYRDTLCQDYEGYDYPMNDEEDSNRFDIFMKFNHPDEVPSAQQQVGYDDADNVEEIGDDNEDNEESFFNLTDLEIQEIVKASVKKILKEHRSQKNNYKKALCIAEQKFNEYKLKRVCSEEAKKCIANLYPGDKKIKKAKKK